MASKKGHVWTSNSSKRLASPFALTAQSVGFTRVQSDANIYLHFELLVIIFVYVDDLLVLGIRTSIDKIFKLLNDRFLIKRTGHLNDDGSTARFLGRVLKRVGDSIRFHMDSNYLEAEFEHYDVNTCRPVTIPGTSTVKRLVDGDEPLDAQGHKKYRSTVGKLQWL